jgi:hypothetical protein
VKETIRTKLDCGAQHAVYLANCLIGQLEYDIADLALMMYYLSEEDNVLEELFKESLMLASLANAHPKEELWVNPLDAQEPAAPTVGSRPASDNDIILRIRAEYVNDADLQSIMTAKREDRRQIPYLLL